MISQRLQATASQHTLLMGLFVRQLHASRQRPSRAGHRPQAVTSGVHGSP
jgi:hypothetical protein